MQTYCAFLRGVNVNGRTMKMADVCGGFLKAGMAGVASVLATGNIIFGSALAQSKLRNTLEQALTKHYGSPVSLFIKTADEVKGILTNVPFKADQKLHIYVFICETDFEKTLMKEFRSIKPAKNEDAKINSGTFYWQCEKGATLDSGFSKILGRKDMKDKFTSRNINTIEKIVAKIH